MAIKRCKGWEKVACCIICVRRDLSYDTRLVKGIAIEPDSGKEYCNYVLVADMIQKALRKPD